ncbi:MAG: diadenylate cyclase CdaA [Clostridiales bacterium]|nr:diadenylate cyclase CdaA [Candidatus Equinaster intestinalis]
MLESLNTFWSQILYAFINIRFFDILDIIAVAFIIYECIKFFRDSRAGQLIKGILVVLAIFVLADWFELVTIKWLLMKFADSIIIVAAIVFQPELRRALEKMGHSNISNLGKQAIDSESEKTTRIIGEICKAASNMQEKKIGALMVFERKTPLGEIADTGTEIDAAISTELVQNVFYPKSPLHDGGMIIRNNRILSAGCILPLTTNNDLNSALGTRHRAAIGMSESSDAVVVVVSEETGNISIACNGALTRDYDSITLRKALQEYLLVDDTKDKAPLFTRIRNFFRPKDKKNGEVKEEK